MKPNEVLKRFGGNGAWSVLTIRFKRLKMGLAFLALQAGVILEEIGILQSLRCCIHYTNGSVRAEVYLVRMIVLERAAFLKIVNVDI